MFWFLGRIVLLCIGGLLAYYTYMMYGVYALTGLNAINIVILVVMGCISLMLISLALGKMKK